MEIGTKIEMDNGELGIQQGVIIEDDGWNGIIAWDVPEEDHEQLGDNIYLLLMLLLFLSSYKYYRKVNSKPKSDKLDIGDCGKTFVEHELESKD